MADIEAMEEAMNDDLVRRLRAQYDCSTQREAANRIEELEAKLAKAVEALEEIATDEHPIGWTAIAALEELKGDT